MATDLDRCVRKGAPHAREYRMRARLQFDYPHRLERGAAANVGRVIEPWIPAERSIVVVSDTTVAGLYADHVMRSLQSAGRATSPLVLISPGEKSKTRETVDHLIDRFLSLGIHRRSVVLALGGGVISDTVGYVAATYMRGIDYINVPTSMIGQVDAAIGGKVGVNHPRSKNFIGTFHHPLAVVIDPDLLTTLPVEEVRNGLAEVVKIAMIHDADLFELMEKAGEGLLAPAVAGPRIDEIIARAIRHKIALLEPDPFEVDLRRVLNFGHTFAHPLEVNAGYGFLRHGYAVSIGMCIAARVAFGRGLLTSDTLSRLLALLSRLGLPTEGPSGDANEVWHHVQVVRKIRADHLHFVIPVAIGRTRIIDDLTREEFVAAYRSMGRSGGGSGKAGDSAKRQNGLR